MAVGIIILICSAWLIYNYMTLYFDWPYMMLIKNPHYIVQAIINSSIKFSLPFGVLGLFLGISFLVNVRKSKETDGVFQYGFMVLSILLSLVMFL